MTASPPAAPLADRYQLVEPARDRALGGGWRARDLQRPEATVLIKRLAVAGEAPPEALAALRALRTFRHPAVPAVLSYGTHDGAHWIATEDVPGDSVGTLLDRARASDVLVPLALLRGAFAAVADAMASAHRHAPPLLHGGISPGSVVCFTPPGAAPRFALLDLGLAPWLGPSPDAPVRSARNLIARPPELFHQGERTERTDVFLLAALLTEMLARPAPSGETLAAVGVARRRDDVPGPVWEVLARAMSLSPAARFGDVAALIAAVDAAWAAPVTAVPKGASAYPDSLLESIVINERPGPSLAPSPLPRWKIAPEPAAPVYGAMPALPEAPEPPTTFDASRWSPPVDEGATLIAEVAPAPPPAFDPGATFVAAPMPRPSAPVYAPVPVPAAPPVYPPVPVPAAQPARAPIGLIVVAGLGVAAVLAAIAVALVAR